MALREVDCGKMPDITYPLLDRGVALMDAQPEQLKEELLHRIRGKQGYEKIPQALELAFNVHGDVTRKEGKPYVVHPLRVALRLVQYRQVTTGSMPNQDELCVALLHDIREDSANVTQEMLLEGFGEVVNQDKIGRASCRERV